MSNKSSHHSTKAQPWFALPNQGLINTIAIIGGGLSGMCLAYHLTQIGLNVKIFDTGVSLPQGASQNQVALVKPQLSPDYNIPDQYYTAAFLYFLEFIKNHPELKLGSGILELSHSEKMQTRHQKILQKRELQNLAEFVDSTTASSLAGVSLNHAALYLKDALLLDVQAYYRLLQQLCGKRLEIISTCKAEHLEYADDTWIINKEFTFDAVVFAHGYQGFEDWIDTNTLIACPGQLSMITPSQALPLKCALSFEGYLTPAINGRHFLGASFRHEESLEIRDADHQQNLNYLRKAAPLLSDVFAKSSWQAWCAVRTTSLDHLPLIGGVPIKSEWLKFYERVKFGDFRARQYPNCPYYPNLYMSLAHGSKGVISSFYASMILTTIITQQDLPLGAQALNALHPARFWLRELKRSR